MTSTERSEMNGLVTIKDSLREAQDIAARYSARGYATYIEEVSLQKEGGVVDGYAVMMDDEATERFLREGWKEDLP